MTQVPVPHAILDLLDQSMANAGNATQLFLQRLREHPDSPVGHDQLQECEHRGDRITAKIGDAMAANPGASPSLRSSVSALATSVDDVVDHVERLSDLLDLYGIEAAMQQSIDQCTVLARAVWSLGEAIASFDDPVNLARHLTAIKDAEDDGDRLERQAIAALFADDDIDPRVIIQWKDIFEGLEAAIDCCERSGRMLWALASPSD